MKQRLGPRPMWRQSRAPRRGPGLRTGVDVTPRMGEALRLGGRRSLPGEIYEWKRIEKLTLRALPGLTTLGG